MARGTAGPSVSGLGAAGCSVGGEAGDTVRDPRRGATGDAGSDAGWDAGWDVESDAEWDPGSKDGGARLSIGLRTPSPPRFRTWV